MCPPWAAALLHPVAEGYACELRAVPYPQAEVATPRHEDEADAVEPAAAGREREEGDPRRIEVLEVAQDRPARLSPYDGDEGKAVCGTTIILPGDHGLAHPVAIEVAIQHKGQSVGGEEVAFMVIGKVGETSHGAALPGA